jgi:hypothetical protein
MEWARFLAYITGTVDRELLLRNEYLAAENRILKAQVRGRLCLSNSDRVTLGEIGHRLGRKALGEVANAALPDTILGWYRRLIARKFNGSPSRRSPGRPRVNPRIVRLIVRMAKENSSWGYDRIVGALANARTAGPKPEPECLRRAMDQVSKGRVFVQAHSVRRTLLEASTQRICSALPCRAKSSRQRQRLAVSAAKSSREGKCPAVPSRYRHRQRGAATVPRATGWAPTLLPSRGRVIARSRFKPELRLRRCDPVIQEAVACGRCFTTRCPISGASIGS